MCDLKRNFQKNIGDVKTMDLSDREQAQRDRQTDRQAGRQTETETETERQRETHKEREYVITQG